MNIHLPNEREMRGSSDYTMQFPIIFNLSNDRHSEGVIIRRSLLSIRKEGRKMLKWNPGHILCEVKKCLFYCVSNKKSQQYTFRAESSMT